MDYISVCNVSWQVLTARILELDPNYMKSEAMRFAAQNAKKTKCKERALNFPKNYSTIIQYTYAFLISQSPQ